MIEGDTIKLLRECNAGIKMGMEAIDQVLPKIENQKLRDALEKSRKEHGRLGDRTHELLNRYHDGGKEPNPLAKTMSWVKTNFKQAAEADPNKAAASLITDGCGMGIKSLNRYLNQYEAAEERAKDIAQDLIGLENTLTQNMRPYL